MAKAKADKKKAQPVRIKHQPKPQPKRRLVVSLVVAAVIAAVVGFFAFLSDIFSNATPPAGAGLLSAAQESHSDVVRRVHPSSIGLTQSQIDAAIHSMAFYLSHQAQSDGQFVYRVSLDPRIRFKPGYNILRHAGAIYSLASYYRKYPNAEGVDLVVRAGRYLTDERVAPVPGTLDMRAIWSTSESDDENDTAFREAKLGAAGIGLVALMSIESLRPGQTPIEELRRLGRFVVWMQKRDGSFYTRLLPAPQGRDDSWTSLYYPGEAALGLIMLYEKDPSKDWLNSAARALGYLAELRAGASKVEADHWALLATARLLPHYDKIESPTVTREAIIQHAAQVCESILKTKAPHSEGTDAHGCFTKDGRTTPTSTRLEGLQAALTFLPEDRVELRREISAAVDDGISFLNRAYIPDGPFQGAVPASIDGSRKVTRNQPPSKESEVRIDYVQHALSALMQYNEIARR